MTPFSLTYTERSEQCLSKIAKQLLQLMDEKKTNLCLSADVTKAKELIELAQDLGSEICVLKTHIDIIQDFTPELTATLHKIAIKKHFFIFEDRKFADIGNTVKLQYEGGIYRIVNWADIINAHALPGPGLIEGLAQVGRKKNRGLLLLAEMSSKGNLITEDYIQSTLQMAEKYSDFVIGFITQHAAKEPHWLNFTPGIQLDVTDDKLGQQYHTPESAILERGTDVIIVGRGIIEAKNPLAEAALYRKRGWDAYLRRCN